MSDTTIVETTQDTGAVSTADLERMLEESRAELERATRERDEERGRRFQTERERDEITGRAQSAEERRYAAEMQAAEGGITAAQADADRAEEAYVAAMEAGDPRAAAKAQRAIAEATTRHTQARAKKEWLESNKSSLTRFEAPEQRSGDEYERIVPDIHASEKAWLKERPEFLNNQTYRSRVFAASNLAVAESLQRGSEAYFRRMEEVLGESKREAPEPPRRAERQMSSDVAPGRRAAPGAAPAGSREISLTADQVEVADSLYGNPSSPDYIADQGARYKKYSDNLARMRASGRL